MSATKALGFLTLFALSGTFSAESRIQSCDGVDEEWSQCPARTCEPDCKPIHCTFGPWSAWSEGGGCTQLKFRERSIATSNNECGQPCVGPKIESARSPQEECAPAVKRDCKVGDWQDWTPCVGLGGESQRRQRVVEQNPENDGFPCTEKIEQIVPCNAPKPIPCLLDDWGAWSDCSVTCGVGVAERSRKVLSHAENDGDACTDVLSEVGACQVKACPEQDCLLAAWLEWSACDVEASQQYRTRPIKQGSLGGGAPCVGDIRETMPCPTEPTNMCVLTDWSNWGICSKSCEGQQHRTRMIVSSIVGEDAKNCRWDAGQTGLTLHETSECNSQSCDAVDVNCKLSKWTTWGACSAKCGQGFSVRKRTVETLALAGGLGCIGALQEVQDCEGIACDDSECIWGEWFPWSACTTTCGLGTKIRNRAVIQPPSFGKMCEEYDKSEVAACQEQPCSNNCVNAEWAPWTDWTVCSTTCSEGFRKRTRVLEREATSCGQPEEGSAIDFQQCVNEIKCVPDIDCSLSQWGDWSPCSCSCFGLRERGRSVVSYASGKGKACDLQGLREVEPCNPGIHERMVVGDKLYSERLGGCGVILAPVDCELSDWAAWSPCSRTCGGGQKTRARRILTFPVGSGSECQDDLESTVGCATESCVPTDCIDCELTEWSEWSACSHCGGQRFRHKMVSVMPNGCGKPCPLSALKEASNCKSFCEEKLSCVWSAWSGISSCNSALGGNAVKSRTLSFLRDNASDNSELFQSLESGLCIGNQVFATTCGDPSCETCKDCIFSQWSDWAEASCLGFCTRIRTVVQQGNRCGKSCDGALKDTKPCSPRCKKTEDCVVGDWAEWTTCDQPNGQKTRARAIDVYPVGVGKFCDKVLEETTPCIPDDREPCVMSEWGFWGQCSLSCGGGYQLRSRDVLRHASPRGKQCDDSLEELQPCSTQPCPNVLTSNCIYSNWSASGVCVHGQRQYDRSIIHFASGSGRGCYEALSTLKPCTNSVQDCVISQWTGWDVCDQTCGGGQQTRKRHIEQLPSEGGKACEEASGTLELNQAQGCSLQECSDQNCLLSDWGDWSKCSSDCSQGGLTTRGRSILRSRMGTGIGCEGNLSETAPCKNMPPCQTHQSDCTWAQWSNWGACTCSCGGGQRSRVRDVATFPTLGGRVCDPMVKEEVGDCNTQSCEYAEHVDGVWDSWSEWTGCSSSCQSGTRFRHRDVGIMANAFGNPPIGDSFETEFCNTNVSCVQAIDCKFSDWSLWSACSTACDGTKERSRDILQYSRGMGKHCGGALEEVIPCNPGLDDARPEECQAPTKTDCEISQWTDWSSCSATCGGGQTFRERGIIHHVSGGGKPCSNDTKEVTVCSTQACPTHAVDCEIGDWTSWSPCNKCSGQKERTRLLKQEAKFGGRQCNFAEMKDIAPCPFTCGEVGFCVWKDWGDWSSCENACGPNRKTSRVRRLVFSNASAEGTRLVSASSFMPATAKPTNAPVTKQQPARNEGDAHHLRATPRVQNATEGGDAHHLRATPRVRNVTEGKIEIIVDKQSVGKHELAEEYVPLDWKVKTLAFSSGGGMILLALVVTRSLRSFSAPSASFTVLPVEEPAS